MKKKSIFVYGSGENLVAYGDKIWRLGSDEENIPIAQDIEKTFGFETARGDIHDMLRAIVKTARKPRKNRGETKTEVFLIHDIDRYISDDIAINATFQETALRYSVGVYSVNYKVGVSGYQEYWHYDKTQRKDAMSCYNTVCTTIADMVDDIEFNEVPHALAKPYLRKRLDKIDVEHKERSGVYHYNWYVTDVEKAEDWRTTIYGTRYPRAEPLERIDKNWNQTSPGGKIELTGNNRNQVLRYRYASKEAGIRDMVDKVVDRSFWAALGSLGGAFLMWYAQNNNLPIPVTPEDKQQIVHIIEQDGSAEQQAQQFQQTAEVPEYEPAADAPRGIRNNNPGNIDRNEKWQGMTENQTDSRFISFESPEWGIRAITQVLRNYEKKYGLNTVEGIINRWAPPVENDTGSYINNVAQSIGTSPKAKLDLSDRDVLLPLIKAIIQHENGQQPYSDDAILKGIGMESAAKEMPIVLDSPKLRQNDVPDRMILPFWSNQIHTIGKDPAKDMAFPTDIPYDRRETDTGAFRLDEMMTDETASREKTRHGEPEWLGSGQFGSSIECSPGFACKYTDDPGEALAARKARDLGERGGVVTVHEVKKVQSNPTLWAITMDKVDILKGLEKQLYTMVVETIREHPDDHDRRFSIYEKFFSMFDWNYGDDLEGYLSDVDELDSSAREMIAKLAAQGFSDEDIHGDNVGWTPDGNMVLFDLGFSITGKDSPYYRRVDRELKRLKPNWRGIGTERQEGGAAETRTRVIAQTKPMALEPGAYKDDPNPHRMTRHRDSVPTPYGGRILQEQDPKEIEEMYAGTHASTNINIAAIYANNKGTKADPPVVIEFSTKKQWGADVDAMHHYIDGIHEAVKETEGLPEAVQQFEETGDWKYIEDVFDEIENDDEYRFDEESDNDMETMLNDTLQRNSQRATLSDLADFFKAFYVDDENQQTFDFQPPRYLQGFYEWYLAPLLTGKGQMDARIDAWFMNQMRFMDPIEEDEILAISEVSRYNPEIYDPWNSDSGTAEYRDTDEEGRHLLELLGMPFVED